MVFRPRVPTYPACLRNDAASPRPRRLHKASCAKSPSRALNTATRFLVHWRRSRSATPKWNCWYPAACLNGAALRIPVSRCCPAAAAFWLHVRSSGTRQTRSLASTSDWSQSDRTSTRQRYGGRNASCYPSRGPNQRRRIPWGSPSGCSYMPGGFSTSSKRIVIFTRLTSRTNLCEESSFS